MARGRRGRDGEGESEPSADFHDLVYEGERDSDGLPHGRGRLRLDDDGVWHEGRFVRGTRHGRGTLRFPPDDWEGDRDDDENKKTQNPFPAGGDRLCGTFKDGVCHGPAVYTSNDGCTKRGVYTDGELRGVVTEFDASGKVVFYGEYKDGCRHGDGVLCQPDGSVVASTWHDNEMSAEALFVYPKRYGVPAVSVDSITRVKSRDQAVAVAELLTSPALYGIFFQSKDDTLEGEDLFFHRHDVDGVVYPGSVLARFEEFGDNMESTHLSTCVNPKTFNYYPGYSAATKQEIDSLCVWLIRSKKHWKDKDKLVGNAPFSMSATSTNSEPFEKGRVGKTEKGVCAVRDLRQGEIVGFVSGKRVSMKRGGTIPNVKNERWHPNGEDVFFIREAIEDEEDIKASEDEASQGDESPSDMNDSDDLPVFDTVVCDGDTKKVLSSGGVFFVGKHKDRLKTVGTYVFRDVRFKPNTKRTPFRHPVLGAVFALVATRPIQKNETITQAPDYECGWACSPVSEAGYYHHLRVSPPGVVFEKLGVSGLGTVKVTEHGPWRVLWLDGVEQGLAYDPWFHGDKNPDGLKHFTHWPNALGFEYVRAMATTTLLACRVFSLSLYKENGRNINKIEALCVGLGAGSLPVFLRNAGLRVMVDCVEIDEVVVEAAMGVLGADLGVNSNALVVEDASVFVRDAIGRCMPGGKPIKYDVICLDAYDGAGNIPEHLTKAEFLQDVRTILSSSGTIVANCFYGPKGSKAHANLKSFCDTLGTFITNAPPVIVKLVQVSGQESNVVVVASANVVENAFSDPTKIHDAFAWCRENVSETVYETLCHETRLNVFDP